MKEIKDFTVIERVQYGDMYFALTLQHPGVMQPVMHFGRGAISPNHICGCEKIRFIVEWS